MARIETKVWVACAGALAAGVVDWALATYVFRGHAVPSVLDPDEVFALVPAIFALVAGYLAPHSPRPPP